jgi:lactoylglutathione lyase
MKIQHIAIWTKNLEALKAFYETYFQALSGKKYINPNTYFESYFLSFSTGARIEIMQIPGILTSPTARDARHSGYAHLAFSVGSKTRVNQLTDILEKNGIPIQSRPRTTGDGYYESVILDPDGNKIEITV